MGEGWESTYEDTFGEFQFGVWLRNAIGRADDGDAAAAGWGGDRFAVLQGPDDAWVLVMRTSWDTAADGAQFLGLAEEALDDAGGESQSFGDGEEAWILVGSDAETLQLAAEA